MASGSHLSKQLQQLIKSIGQTKSKQEEDKIIGLQLANLKPKLSQKNLTPKKLKELLIRALYIQMLGHSVSFAHIQAINLTQNKNLVLKRIGYLLCSLFLNKDSELLIMLVSTIQKDLISTDVHQIVICLTSLGNIMNETIVQAVRDLVIKLLSHVTDLVRKKAVLIMQKIESITINSIPDYKDKLKKALCDRQPSVMAAALNLYLEEIKINPKKYRDLMASFVIILKQVIEHKLPKQFDYHRLPAPWIQMKLLKIIELLGKNDLKASQNCYTILQQALKRAQDASNNISFAVTYQCVQTIATIYPNQGLLEQAAASLSKFLQSNSSNLKYMGIQALGQLYKQYPQVLNEYQLTIVDCLQSKDETLKKQTLQLLFRMTNQDNIQITVSKMLDSLHSSTDGHFRNALVLKIIQLAERFALSHKWYLQTMQILFQLGSQYLNDQILTNFLRLVIQNYQQDQQFGVSIIDQMINLLQKVVPTDFILKVTSWIIGQLGSSYYTNNLTKISQLVGIIIKCFQSDFQNCNTKVWLLDALVKLSTVKDFPDHSKVKLLLQKYSKDKGVQIYQRALECKKIAKYNVALRKNYQIDYEQNLPFLDGFVENALKNGAKQYQKGRIKQTNDTSLRFKAYQSSSINQTSIFPFKQEQKKVTKITTQPLTIPSNPISTSEKEIIQEKPKKIKQFITPQQKAKKNLANALFGNPKGQSTKPNPPPNNNPTINIPNNKKKQPQNTQLI